MLVSLLSLILLGIGVVLGLAMLVLGILFRHVLLPLFLILLVTLGALLAIGCVVMVLYFGFFFI